MMNNHEKVIDVIDAYFRSKAIELQFNSLLSETSKNTAGERYVYAEEYSNICDLAVIDMDTVANDGYRKVYKISDINERVNTADAFLVNSQNEWFFVEFKDCELKADNSKQKNNIIKKAYANWYMLLDILFDQKDMELNFDYGNPIKFAKEHVTYIVVCSTDKNARIVTQIKNHSYKNENYCPPFMNRLKNYLFKDAILFTEDYFYRNFVKNFTYIE